MTFLRFTTIIFTSMDIVFFPNQRFVMHMKNGFKRTRPELPHHNQVHSVLKNETEILLMILSAYPGL